MCIAEARTLITLDRDFGHVPRFPPQQSALSFWSWADQDRFTRSLIACVTFLQSLPPDLSAASFGSLNPGE
jgi:hypothetical protein